MTSFDIGSEKRLRMIRVCFSGSSRQMLTKHLTLILLNVTHSVFNITGTCSLNTREMSQHMINVSQYNLH